MAYSKVNYHEVEPIGGAMHFLRDPLECEQLGLTVVECPPGWTGKEHDHADRDHEEVYLVFDGEATITVDGDEVALETGDALRVSPEATRQVHNGDTQSTLIIAGAP